ncbi:hypothetical protein ACFVR6_14195 [Microbacterium sp. NPDC058021]|uniref:hypothetical protein n=1 Tax=Microbacterium sp. NPDC058021 TaxID=3346306 RepID=UPI0036DD6F97
MAAAAPVRDRIVPVRRPPACQYADMRILRILAALVIAVAALSACAPTPQPQPTADAATPTSTPMPRPSAPPTGPVLAYDGECASVFADPAAVLGFDAEALPGDADLPTGLVTLGGLKCSWVAVGGTFEAVTLMALPVTQVPEELRSRFATTACEWSFDTPYCHLAGSVGETWVMVSKRALDEVGTPPDLAPVLAAALERAATVPAPIAATPTDEWWDSVDCATVEQAAGIAEVYAPATFEPGYPAGFGSWPTDGMLASTDQWCPWYSYETSEAVWMNLLPGAGSQWDDVDFTGATPVDVVGAEAAVLVTVDDNLGLVDEREVLYATDGTNVLRIQMSPIPLEDLAARVFAGMADAGR